MIYLLPKKQYGFAFPIVLDAITEYYDKNTYEVKESPIVIFEHMKVLKIFNINKEDKKVYSFCVVAITNEIIKPFEPLNINPINFLPITNDSEFEYSYSIIQLATYQISNDSEICNVLIKTIGGPYTKQEPLSWK